MPSIGEILRFERLDDTLAVRAAPLPLPLKCEHVGESDDTMPAVGQVYGCDLPLIEKANHVRPGKAEQLADLGRSQRNLRSQDRHGVIFRKLIG